ncbi:hypothetical protein [Kurthia zopfii]|uniref:hypothetical protein n=1 Tax=Kurthia zopfii TaxID=1650 RepID=UPI000F70ADFF|nr:hypothetical protein [Kurthia zopfii]VEI05240.1 Uncharacterised protein [Kurthia zopfii]
MPMFYGMHVVALLIFLMTFVTALIVGKLYVIILGSLLAIAIVIWSFVQRKKALDK